MPKQHNKIPLLGNAKKILTKDCFNFKGKVNRREYGYYFLFQLIFNIIAIFLIACIGISCFFILEKLNIVGIFVMICLFVVPFFIPSLLLYLIFMIYCIIPTIALFIRRIRDTGIENAILIFLIVLFTIPFSFLMFILIGMIPSKYFYGKELNIKFIK